MNDYKYSDIRTNLDVHPITRDFTLLTGEDSIAQSIKNLVLTGKYERFFHPHKGAGIPQTLFENMDSEIILETKIREVIRNFEPRAIVRDVIVKNNYDRNAYDCTIIYTPINTHENVTLDFILKRVR